MKRTIICIVLLAILAAITIIRFNAQVLPCKSDSDPGHDCIPYCPPDPKECGD
jgi:hypothetical protein